MSSWEKLKENSKGENSFMVRNRVEDSYRIRLKELPEEKKPREKLINTVRIF
jgi:hypothetical protein